MIRIISIICLIFLNSCDYSPLYSSSQNSNFSISSLQITGDRDLSSYLQKGLSLYENKNNKNKYKIEINTSLSKEILVKDKSANTTDYKLIATAKMIFIKYEVDDTNKKSREITFEEVINIKKETNNFEQTTYEYISKINLAEIILNKIILFLNKN